MNSIYNISCRDYDESRLSVYGTDLFLFKKELNKLNGAVYSPKMRFFFFPKRLRSDVENFLKKIKSGEVKPDSMIEEVNDIIIESPSKVKSDLPVSRKEFSNLLKIVEQLKEQVNTLQLQLQIKNNHSANPNPNPNPTNATMQEKHLETEEVEIEEDTVHVSRKSFLKNLIKN